MAAHQTSSNQPASAHRSVHLQRSQPVRGARRMKLAHIPVQRRDPTSPTFDEPNERILQHWHAFLKALRHAEATSSRSSGPASAIEGRARTTTSVCMGVGRSATMCRSRRLTRFLVTALPTFLDTTKPTRVTSGGFVWGGRPTCTTTDAPAAFTPSRKQAVKSAGAFRRREVGSTEQDQADSSARPLRRRAARIRRPARVRMRLRKPWVRLRRRLLGWKVRLLMREFSVTMLVITSPRA